MKKSILLLLVLALGLGLAACGEPVAEVVVVTEVPVMMEPVQPEAAPEPSEQPEPAPEPVPVPIQPELPVVVDEELNAVLDRITADVMPGSAGASLRAACCAALLLDWGSVTELTDDEIYSAVGSWLDMQDDEHLIMFFDSFYPVYDASYDLRGENGESLLRDAGADASAYPWNDRAARAVEMVCYGCGLR